jgi:hypothetical protein
MVMQTLKSWQGMTAGVSMAEAARLIRKRCNDRKAPVSEA